MGYVRKNRSRGYNTFPHRYVLELHRGRSLCFFVQIVIIGHRCHAHQTCIVPFDAHTKNVQSVQQLKINVLHGCELVLNTLSDAGRYWVTTTHFSLLRPSIRGFYTMRA